MKAYKTTVLLVALLLAAGRLAAHNLKDADTHVPAHEHPEFVNVTTTFEFDDGTTVKWCPVPGGRGSFIVTVTQVVTGKEKIYSLLTLGIQSILSDNDITLLSGGEKVLLYEHNVPTGVSLTAGNPVPKTGLNAANDHLDPDKIRFVSFSDATCLSLVKAPLPKALGDTKWSGLAGLRSGHDNTPPNGYPPN